MQGPVVEPLLPSSDQRRLLSIPPKLDETARRVIGQEELTFHPVTAPTMHRA